PTGRAPPESVLDITDEFVGPILGFSNLVDAQFFVAILMSLGWGDTARHQDLPMESRRRRLCVEELPAVIPSEFLGIRRVFARSPPFLGCHRSLSGCRCCAGQL